MAKETYSYGKRDLFIWQKRPIYMAKETYSYDKRDLFIWQKRPIHMAKETYSYDKRDLFIWQKRPIRISIPEVCASVKRDLFLGKRGLFIWQKRPTNTSIPEPREQLCAAVARSDGEDVGDDGEGGRVVGRVGNHDA